MKLRSYVPIILSCSLIICAFSSNDYIERPTINEVYSEYDSARFNYAFSTKFEISSNKSESIFETLEKDIEELSIKAKEHQEYLKQQKEEEEERKRRESLNKINTTKLPQGNVTYNPSNVFDSTGEFLGDFRLTFYCPCVECSEEYGDNTATGVKAVEGVTVAVDPKVIPYGTELFIDGFGTFIAQDCGGAIKGNRIDIYVTNHNKADKLGVKYSNVYRI